MAGKAARQTAEKRTYARQNGQDRMLDRLGRQGGQRAQHASDRNAHGSRQPDSTRASRSLSNQANTLQHASTNSEREQHVNRDPESSNESAATPPQLSTNTRPTAAATPSIDDLRTRVNILDDLLKQAQLLLPNSSGMSTYQSKLVAELACTTAGDEQEGGLFVKQDQSIDTGPILNIAPIVKTFHNEVLKERCNHCGQTGDNGGGQRADKTDSGNSNKSGKLSKCSGCAIIHYCSSQCQRKDWSKGHKYECAALQKWLKRMQGSKLVSKIPCSSIRGMARAIWLKLTPGQTSAWRAINSLPNDFRLFSETKPASLAIIATALNEYVGYEITRKAFKNPQKILMFINSWFLNARSITDTQARASDGLWVLLKLSALKFKSQTPACSFQIRARTKEKAICN
ncbi:hypothetical protein ACM66B_004374 [Microbotryomycetes sp. NB124-2]